MGKSKLIDVDEAEMVARLICEPSMIDEGELSATAFMLVILDSGDPEGYLSVWRLLLKIPTPDNVPKKARKPGDKFAGYATLQVSDINATRHEQISARTYVKKKTNHHAEVHCTNGEHAIKGDCMPPDFMSFALKLCDHSTLTLFEDNKTE